MKLLRGFWLLIKEIARHVLRRPVVGIVAVAKTRDGRFLLIRRSDTGQWALPGGTLEWGETLRQAIVRELAEEAGVAQVSLHRLLGVYSAPDRDFRFHAVTVVVEAEIEAPVELPKNPLEVREVGLFGEHELPAQLSHNTTDMLTHARQDQIAWE
jgi:8-oxo-dGTP diphosphatase